MIHERSICDMFVYQEDISIAQTKRICYLFVVNLASCIASFKERGFPPEQAELLALMSVATGVLFQDFPDSFLLFGGSSLVFFHQSVRHSADIDLLARTEQPPTQEDIRESLERGLSPTAEALHLTPLQFEANAGTGPETKLWVRSHTGHSLFSVDFNRFGSVLESEIEEHSLAIDSEEFAKVKSASREFLLLTEGGVFYAPQICEGA